MRDLVEGVEMRVLRYLCEGVEEMVMEIVRGLVVRCLPPVSVRSVYVFNCFLLTVRTPVRGNYNVRTEQ